MKRIRKLQGFTLAEMVLVLIIVGVVGALAVPSIARITTELLGLGEGAELEEEAGLALERIVQELRVADNGECIGGAQLRLERDSSEIIYRIDASALRRVRNGNAETLVAGAEGLTLSCSSGNFGLENMIAVTLSAAQGLELSTHGYLRR